MSDVHHVPEPPPGEPLSSAVTVTSEPVRTVHTRIRLAEHGQLAGEIEVISLLGGLHLVIGEQQWFRPEGLPGEGVARHMMAVSERLLDEVVALAEQRGAALSSVVPSGWLAPAERLRERGFRLSGEMWYREAPVVDGAPAGPGAVVTGG